MSGTQIMGGYNPYNTSGYDYSTLLRNQDSVAQSQGSVTAAQAQNFTSSPQADTYVATTDMQVTEPAKNRKGLLVVAGLLATGAAATIIVARRGNGSGIIEKLKTGWQSIRKDGLFVSKAKEAIDADKVVDKTLDTVEMIQKNGKTIFRMPGKSQKLAGNGKALADEAAELGLDKIKVDLKDATNVKGMNFVLEDGGVKHLISWNNKTGETSCRTLVKDVAKREKVDLSTMSEEFQNAVKESVEAIKNKDLNKVNEHVKIKNIVYEAKIADGSIGTYLHKGKTGSNVKRIVTDRFGAETDVVAAAMQNDEKLARAVESATALKPGLGGIRRPKYDAWGVRSATHVPKVDGWPKDAKLLIENDKVVGVIEAGNKVDQVRFDALQYRYPDAFKHVMKKDLDDVVRFLK